MIDSRRCPSATPLLAAHERPAVVRPAVPERVGHALHRRLVERESVGEREDAGDAAHEGLPGAGVYATPALARGTLSLRAQRSEMSFNARSFRVVRREA